MKNILQRQTFVFSVAIATLVAGDTSKITQSINLRFPADTLVFKQLAYQELSNDIENLVQIWCDKTRDPIIGSFPNNIPVYIKHDDHFELNGEFKGGSITFELQQTANNVPGSGYSNPQPGIVRNGASDTNGILSFTIEFLQHEK
ncbi:MAG TPA: hypothetical protein PLS50_07140 [Candidatus Dojkabacteria bacterium]|nr:hypothetical protein [Candidatus Dojkabacteria bacterium]